MPAKVPVGTKRKFNEKGSKQNGGRPITVTRTKQADGTWKTTSQNKARADYEAKHGKIGDKDKTVDHKDNNHKNDSKGNLRLLSRSDNTAKENKRRAKKK